jgi:hypothetical protein
MKDMVADHDDLVNLKLLLSNKISFYKISDFYSPLYVIGVGSTAKVVIYNLILGTYGVITF